MEPIVNPSWLIHVGPPWKLRIKQAEAQLDIPDGPHMDVVDVSNCMHVEYRHICIHLNMNTEKHLTGTVRNLVQNKDIMNRSLINLVAMYCLLHHEASPIINHT